MQQTMTYHQTYHQEMIQLHTSNKIGEIDVYVTHEETFKRFVDK
jgi:hypothetical protein